MNSGSHGPNGAQGGRQNGQYNDTVQPGMGVPAMSSETMARFVGYRSWMQQDPRALQQQQQRNPAMPSPSPVMQQGVHMNTAAAAPPNPPIQTSHTFGISNVPQAAQGHIEPRLLNRDASQQFQQRQRPGDRDLPIEISSQDNMADEERSRLPPSTNTTANDAGNDEEPFVTRHPSVPQANNAEASSAGDVGVSANDNLAVSAFSTRFRLLFEQAEKMGRLDDIERLLSAPDPAGPTTTRPTTSTPTTASQANIGPDPPTTLTPVLQLPSAPHYGASVVNHPPQMPVSNGTGRSPTIPNPQAAVFQPYGSHHHVTGYQAAPTSAFQGIAAATVPVLPSTHSPPEQNRHVAGYHAAPAPALQSSAPAVVTAPPSMHIPANQSHHLRMQAHEFRAVSPLVSLLSKITTINDLDHTLMADLAPVVHSYINNELGPKYQITPAARNLWTNVISALEYRDRTFLLVQQFLMLQRSRGNLTSPLQGVEDGRRNLELLLDSQQPLSYVNEQAVAKSFATFPIPSYPLFREYIRNAPEVPRLFALFGRELRAFMDNVRILRILPRVSTFQHTFRVDSPILQQLVRRRAIAQWIPELAEQCKMELERAFVQEQLEAAALRTSARDAAEQQQRERNVDQRYEMIYSSIVVRHLGTNHSSRVTQPAPSPAMTDVQVHAAQGVAAMSGGNLNSGRVQQSNNRSKTLPASAPPPTPHGAPAVNPQQQQYHQQLLQQQRPPSAHSNVPASSQNSGGMNAAMHVVPWFAPPVRTTPAMPSGAASHTAPMPQTYQERLKVILKEPVFQKQLFASASQPWQRQAANYATSAHLAYLKSPKLQASDAEERMFSYVEGLVMDQPFIMSKDFLQIEGPVWVPQEVFSSIPPTIEASNFRTIRQVKNGSHTLRIRCVRFPLRRDGTKGLSEAEWLALEPGLEWPEHLVAMSMKRIDETKTDIQTIEWRKKGPFAKHLPADISNKVGPGHNRWSIVASAPLQNGAPERSVYVIAAESVVYENEPAIRSRITAVTPEETKGRIDRMLSREGDDDDDIQVVSTSISIHLRDPLSGTLAVDAVRSSDCKHLECFDLSSFLDTQALERPEGFRCPLCGADARPQKLQRDQWMATILQDIRWKGLVDDVDAIEVSHGGAWKVQEAKAQPGNEKVTRGRSKEKTDRIETADDGGDTIVIELD